MARWERCLPRCWWSSRRGSETTVVIRVAGETMSAVFRERHHFAPGTQISLRPHSSTLCIFSTLKAERGFSESSGPGRLRRTLSAGRED